MSFEESVRLRRAFMDGAHATLGDTSWIRYPEPPRVPLPTLLQNHSLQAASYIGLAGIPKDKTEETLAALSKDKLVQVNLAMEQLKKRFSSDGNFRQSAKWFSKIGYFENIKRKPNRWYKPWSWDRYDYAIENLAKHVIEKTTLVLSEKNNEENLVRALVDNKIKVAEENRCREYQEAVQLSIDETLLRSRDFLDVVSSRPHCFGSLADDAKEYAESIHTAVTDHLAMASSFNNQKRFNVACSLTEFISKMIDVGKKTACIFSWIGKGSLDGVKELSESLGIAADRLITDPFGFVKATVDSLYDVGVSLGQAAISAVKDPQKFINSASQIISSMKNEFDQLPFEEKISEASKCVTKFVLFGLVGNQASLMAGQYAGVLAQSASIVEKEIQLFKKIEVGAKKFIPSRELVQKLAMPVSHAYLEAKSAVGVAVSGGREVIADFLNFVNGQPAVVAVHGSVGSTLEKGYGSYKDLKEFLSSSANFYKGKVSGGGVGTKPSIKSLIKKHQLPVKGKIRYVPPKKLHTTNGLPSVKANDGFKDRFGNEWFRGPSRTIGEDFEWDVQLSSQGKAQLGWASKSGKHVNVSLKGRITH